MATFTLHSGTGSTAYRGIFSSGGQAIEQDKDVPSAPASNRGPGGTNNKIVLTQVALDIGGYNSTATVYIKVWTTGGTFLSTSPAISLPNNGTTVDLPSVLGNITNLAVDGATTYAFGVYCSSGAMGYQKQANASYDVYLDPTHTSSTQNFDTFDVITSNASRTLIGTVTYVYSPSAPTSVTTSSVTTTSVTVGWSAPSSNGDSAIQRYYVEYQNATDGGSWTSAGTYTNGTTYTYNVTGLLPGKSYNFRVSAYNGASPALGFNSDYGTASATTLSDGDLYVNVNGTWSKGQVYANVSGTWREAEVWVNVSGTWRKGTP